MEKVSFDKLRSDLKSVASVYEEIISMGLKNSQNNPGAEYEHGLEFEAECAMCDI